MTPSRILIVDDEVIIARELESRLLKLGYNVVAIASSGLEAIELAESTAPELILMDIVLKGELDGIEAATEIKRRMEVPVIYVTAYTDNRTLERAAITDPFAYIVKPFNERELGANIEMALFKHRAEQRARGVERWFTRAIQDTNDAVVAADEKGLITLFNEGAEAITSWKRECAMGRCIDDVVRFVSRTTGERLPIQASVEGPTVRLADDTWLLDRLEKQLPVDATLIRLATSRERFESGVVTIFRDVTGERHGALASLSADVALAVAQSLTVEGMLNICAASLVRHLKAAFARIWTLGPGGDQLLLRASAGQYTHLDGRHAKIPVGELKIGRIARDRTPHLTNNVLMDPNISDPEWARREHMVAFAGYPLMVSERVVGVMGMFSRREFSPAVLGALGAISNTIAVGIERSLLAGQATQNQKLEALGQLAAGVAHDFNNLLTVITGYGDLLMRSADLDPHARELISEMTSAGDRATSLTRQLLAFSRRRVLAPTVVDLNQLINDARSMLKRLVGENIEINTELSDSIKMIHADAGQLEQVLINLVVNSRDAIGKQGRITIETRNVHVDDSIASVYPRMRSGEYVMFSVSDTGAGMPAEVVERIFEPFYTTKAEGKGTGLGLATAHGIVTQAGGHILVESQVGNGTTFQVYLPATNDQRPAARGSTAMASLTVGSETLLLVEDDHSVRALAARVMRSCGYTVIEAENGEQALLIAIGFSGTIDLLVTDVVMPKVSGVALYARLSRLRPGLKVIYMSGYAEDDVIRQGLKDGNCALLQKPFAISDLALLVRQVLSKPATSPGRTGDRP